jgi:flagellar biosynthetic protein FliQ
MSQDQVVTLVVDMMAVALKVALPGLLASLVVGLAVSIFQAVTQIQEQTLSFIPKVAALVVVIVIAGPWVLGQIVSYTQNLYEQIPSLIG